MARYRDPHLPLSSLRLLVPPLRLMSACMWQVALERNVNQYDKLIDFITLVTEMVPEILNYKQRSQLILGLRARIIMEFLKTVDPINRNSVQEHLSIFRNTTINCTKEEDPDGEVETSKSAFMELIQTFLNDKYEKDKFLKEEFPKLYGAQFDTMLQILLWEFLYRLEELLPVPSFLKVSSVFELSSCDFQFEEFVSDLDDVRKILQHQKQRQKLTKSEFSFMSNTILSALASKQTSVASEDHVDRLTDGKDGGSSDEETDDSSIELSPSNLQSEEGRLSPLTSSLFYEEAGTAGESDHVSNLVPQSTYRPPPGVYETQVTLSEQTEEEPAADSARVKGCYSDRELKLNELSTTEEIKILTCPMCQERFGELIMLQQHLSAEHPSVVEVFRCDKCDKTFQTKRRLEQHHQAHASVKPYVCSHCGKGLACPKVLKTHMRLHTGERPYACKFCDKKFDQSTALKEHVRLHNGERPFLCSECGKGFPSSGAFLIHSRYHTGERPYHCKDCGKTFVTMLSLKCHQRLHTGERPYTCAECGKSFRLHSGWSRHKRVHTGERPYKCHICDKRFHTSYNLKTHMKSHSRKPALASTE